MEKLFSPQPRQTHFTVVLGGLAEGEELGYYFSDRGP